MLREEKDPVGLAFSVILEDPTLLLSTVRPEDQRVPMARALESALEQLTAGQRTVLMMRFGLESESLVYEEGDVAREMGVGVGVVKQHYSNGLTHLRSSPLREILERCLLQTA